MYRCNRSRIIWLGFWLAAASGTISATATAEIRMFAEGRVSAGITDQHGTFGGGESSEGLLENADAFTILMPRGVLLSSTGRSRHRVSYALATRLNLLRRAGNSISNRLDWQSNITTSAAGDLSLGAAVHQGHTSAYDLAFPRVIEPLPEGGTHFATGRVDQSYTHRLDPVWQLGQRAEAGFYYPFSGERNADYSYRAGGGLHAQRRLRRNAIRATVDGRYVSISRPALPGAGAPVTDRHVVGGAHLSGSRELSARWRAALGAGVVALSSVEAPTDDPLVLPAAQAALQYAVNDASASLSYSYDIDTRLIIAETSATHLVQLRGVLPVRAIDGVWLSGAVGYRSGRIIDSNTADYIGRSDVLLFDGRVAWAFRPGFTVSARVQSYQQRREDRASLARDQSRSQVMVSLSARFPPAAGAIPPGVGSEWAADPADSGDE